VSSADSDVDDISEVIDISVDQSSNEVTTGVDATLCLFIALNGPTAATVKLFGHATVEADESSESSSSPGAGGSLEWVLYGSVTVDVDGRLWVVSPLPAGQYKVMVSAMTGAGSVIVRESHSA
jgi:hypothetical protein